MNISFAVTKHINTEIPIIHAHVNETLFMDNINTLSKLLVFLGQEESFMIGSSSLLENVFNEARELNIWSLSIMVIEDGLYIIDTLKLERYLFDIKMKGLEKSKPFKVFKSQLKTVRSICTA